jgi:predicted ArsR family transcriptional regulator
MVKNFKGGMDSLLGETTGKGTPKRGRPKTNFKAVAKTSEAGTKENETRATFIVNKEQLAQVKALAHWERLSIKEVLAQAIAAHLESKKRELSKAVESYKKSERL